MITNHSPQYDTIIVNNISRFVLKSVFTITECFLNSIKLVLSDDD